MGPYPHDAPPPTISRRESHGDGRVRVRRVLPSRTRLRWITCSGAWGSTPSRSTGPNRSRSIVRAASTCRQRRAGLVRGEVCRGAWPVGSGDGLQGGGRRLRLQARAVARRKARGDLRRAQRARVFPPSKALAGCTSISWIATAPRARSTTWTSSGSASPVASLPGAGSGTSTTSRTTCIAGGSTSGRASTSASSTSARSATSTSRAG